MVTRTIPAGAYGIDGQFRQVNFHESPNGLPTVILLQYRQSKNMRAGRQADRAGDVIQERGDGQISGLIPIPMRDGSVVLRQYADIVAERKVRPSFEDLACDPQPCDPPPSGGGGGWTGGGGGGSNNLPLAYITQLETRDVEDNAGLPWEQNEFEFHVTDGNGARFDPWPGVEGIESTEIRNLSIPIMYSPALVGPLQVIVVETDFLFDDVYAIPGPKTGDHPCEVNAHPPTLTGNAGYLTFMLYKLHDDDSCTAFPYSQTVLATFYWSTS